MDGTTMERRCGSCRVKLPAGLPSISCRLSNDHSVSTDEIEHVRFFLLVYFFSPFNLFLFGKRLVFGNFRYPGLELTVYLVPLIA